MTHEDRFCRVQVAGGLYPVAWGRVRAVPGRVRVRAAGPWVCGRCCATVDGVWGACWECGAEAPDVVQPPYCNTGVKSARHEVAQVPISQGDSPRTAVENSPPCGGGYLGGVHELARDRR